MWLDHWTVYIGVSYQFLAAISAPTDIVKISVSVYRYRYTSSNYDSEWVKLYTLFA